ncbi:MAG: HIT family protein [Candidatus Aenigmarchaeota archaeon]|nr:HIT family protein [Candidatus Aenigmarchaeota archaeon]
MQNECIFCKIVSGEVRSEKVYEDDDVVAFLDVNPSAPGHTVVVPKQHFSSILDMDDDLLCKVFKAVKKVTGMIKESLNPDGFTIGINQGEAAGGRIPHLNVHIIPRFRGDGGIVIQMVVRNVPEEDLSTIAEKIRSSGGEISTYLEERVEEKPKKLEEVLPVEKEGPTGEMKFHLEPEEERKKEGIDEKKLEEYEKEELEEKEKKYKGKKKIKDKEEEELEEMERILRQMQIPR